MTALSDDDARAAFEKWAVEHFGWTPYRYGDGYAAVKTQHAWLGYRAGIVQGMRKAADIVGHSDASAINAVADQLEGQP